MSKTEKAKTDLEDVKQSIFNNLPKNFADYDIRKMIEHSSKLGESIAILGLKTNQIRKFLDAINRIKASLAQHYKKSKEDQFEKIKPSIVLLKPKLAYVAARKNQNKIKNEETAAIALKDIISKIIDHTHSVNDFQMLANFVEAIVAYHKAAGGKTQ